jgi:hypothetical protein
VFLPLAMMLLFASQFVLSIVTIPLLLILRVIARLRSSSGPLRADGNSEESEPQAVGSGREDDGFDPDAGEPGLDDIDDSDWIPRNPREG